MTIDHEDYGRLWAFGYGAITGFVQKALESSSHSAYLRACLPQVARRQAASIVAVRYDLTGGEGEDDVHVAERWQRSDRNAHNWAPVLDAIGWESENEGRPVGRMLHREDCGIETVGMACPLFAPGGAVAGFLAILTETEGDPSPQFLLGQLAGTAALVNAGLRPTASAATHRAVPDATSALARGGRHPDLRSYGHSLCAGLRDRVGCEQVVFAIARGSKVEVLSVSGLDDIAPRSTAVQRIAEAMGECLDLGEPVLVQEDMPKPPDGKPASNGQEVSDAEQTEDDQSTEEVPPARPRGIPAIHRAWHQDTEFSAILTLPLPGARGTTALISFVRPRKRPFEQVEIEQLRAATAAVGPAVDLLRAARRSVLAHTRDSLRSTLSSMKGLRSARRLVTTVLVLGLLGWFWFGTTDHTIVLDGRVEPARKIHLTAPFEARLVETQGEAGDLVEEGQVICRFETDDLELELARHIADAETNALESQQALAVGDVQAANLAEARQRVAQARQSTLQQQIVAATVTAPFRGRLLRGDLEQRIGQILPLGEPLFELSRIGGETELRIQVPEEHGLEVRAGGAVQFVSNARPDQELQFEIRSVAPAADVVDTVNAFEVVAVPTSGTDLHDVRAGMEGLCEVSLGDRAVWRSALDPLIRWSNRNLWW